MAQDKNFHWYDQFRRMQDKFNEASLYKTKFENLQLQAKLRIANHQNKHLEAVNKLENQLQCGH